MGKKSEKQIAADGSVLSEPETLSSPEDLGPTGLSSEDDVLVEESAGRMSQARACWDRANRKNKTAMEACRHLQGCADYATPGAPGVFVSADEPMDVWYERLGANSNWQACNEEFCRRWVTQCWVPSVPAAGGVFAIAQLRALIPPSPEARLARKFYLRLFEAEDPQAVVEEVVAELAATRLRLGDARFKLREYFGFLAGQFVIPPSARQLERAGELYPWQESNRTRALAPVRPQDVTVELWDDQRLRFCTEGRAIRTFTLGRTSTERTLSAAQWRRLTDLVLFHVQNRGTTGAAVDHPAEPRWVMEVDTGKWNTWRRGIPRLNEFLVGSLNLTSDPLRCETHGRVVVCTFGGFSERASPASWNRERSAGMGDEEPAVGNARLPEESFEER